MKIVSTLFILSFISFSAISQNVGIGTTTPTARLHVTDSSVLFSAIGNLPVEPSIPPAEGAGRRMMWYADKAAFRSGRVTGTFWDRDSIGIYSVAMGYNSKATGAFAFAAGYGNSVTGTATSSLGYNNQAFGDYSLALGYNSKSLNTYAVAIGNNPTASGENAIAIGNTLTASGINALSLGKGGSASGTESVSIMGGSASGNNSMAVMSGASATGDRAIAIGRSVSAPSYAEVVFGLYNTEYTPALIGATAPLADNDRLFTIGNGYSSSNRSDALVILKNGNAGFGISTPTNKLEVVGKTKTTNLQITNGAINNYVLKSDASGNASWSDVNNFVTTSLDKAYDVNGSGLGRTITADAGAVRISGTDGLLVSGVYGTGKDIDLEMSGPGNRMYYHPKKAAFGIGEMTLTNWDPFTMVGNYSTAMGTTALAMGNYSTAIGYFPLAQGEYGVALGSGVQATGIYSLAMGRSSTASGLNSTAMGYGTTAPSYGETSIGLFNTSYTHSSSSTFNSLDRIFVVGNGTTTSTRSDALTILKNGGMKIGNRGTYFTNVQEGVISGGTQVNGVNAYKKSITLNFPYTFINANNVKVQLTAKTTTADAFFLSVRNITTTNCTIDICRVDQFNSTIGWATAFDIQWLAWESMPSN